MSAIYSIIRKYRQCILLRKGFSLVEMVIYVALLALLLVALLSAVNLMLRSWSETQAHMSLAHSGALAMERMVREVRNAATIDAAGSAFGTTTGILEVVAPGGAPPPPIVVAGGAGGLFKGRAPAGGPPPPPLGGGGRVLPPPVGGWWGARRPAPPPPTTFFVSGGALDMLQGSAPAAALTDPGVGVQALTFYDITTPNSQAVRILLILVSATTTIPIYATFYDTAVLRNSY